jgi:hypothetical protein
MERELWPLLYHELREAANDFRQKYVQIPGWVLVAVSLWAALHDRPVAWACDGRNWGTTSLRPRKLPSPSTMSRRAYSVGVGLLRRALQERLRALGPPPALVAMLDGKPLPVGGYTKDPDAAYGRGAGMMAKGYKLHTVWSNGPLPDEWEVTSLKVGETTEAGGMPARPRERGGGGYLLADGNYDSSELFDQAAEAGYQLVVPMGANAGGATATRAPGGYVASSGCGAAPGRTSGRRCTRCGRASRGGSATRRASLGGWGRCRRGCGGCTASASGSGPSSSSTPHES